MLDSNVTFPLSFEGISYTERNIVAILNDELRGVWKEAVVAPLKTFRQNLPT
jgi:hypothetical protein